MQIASPTDYGNQLVNAILWVKQKAAAQQNIPFCVHSSVPSEIPVDGKYVTSILTNLLDNALEASQKTGKTTDMGYFRDAAELLLLLRHQSGSIRCFTKKSLAEHN